MRNPESANLQSVNRAVRALELIAEAGELGVTELGRRLDVHKATASRLVATLAERGLVERDPVTEKYRLGFGLIRLAGAAMAGLDLVRRAAHPLLEDLAERTRETVNLGVLSGDAVVYVDQVIGDPRDRERELGGPAHASALHVQRQGAAGAHGTGGARSIARPSVGAARRRPRSWIPVRCSRRSSQEIKTRGYAQTMEELEEGLNAVAAPVRQADGEVVAALSVRGPAFRMRARRSAARWLD